MCREPFYKKRLEIEIKDRSTEKVTIYIPIFYLVKSSANVIFFLGILLDYVAHEITKEF